MHVKQQRGQKIKIGLMDESILIQIREFIPDIVGISNNFTTFYKDASDLAVLIKTKFPEILLVGGGNHISQEHEKIMGEPYFDMLVRGEGEYAMIEMVDHLERKKSFSGIKGLVWRDKDGKNEVLCLLYGVPWWSCDDESRVLLQLYLLQYRQTF